MIQRLPVFIRRARWFLLISAIFTPALLPAQKSLKFEKFINLPQIGRSETDLQHTRFIFRDTFLVLWKGYKFSYVNHRQIEPAEFRDLNLPRVIEKSLDRRSDLDCFYDGDTLLAKSNDLIMFLVYDPTQKNFVFVRSIKIKGKFADNISANDKHWYVHRTYNSSPLSKEIRCGFMIKDKHSLEEKVVELPFDFLEYTHISPNNYISFMNDRYLFAQCNSYSAKIFSLDGKLMDSIPGKKIEAFKGLSPEQMSKFNGKMDVAVNPSDYLSDLMALPAQGARIWETYFLDSSSVYVRFSLPIAASPGFQFYDHVWHKGRSGWTLVNDKDLSSIDLSQPLTQQNIWPYTFVGTKRMIQNGKLYYLTWTSEDNAPGIKTVSDYLQEPLNQKKYQYLSIAVFSMH